MDRKSLSVFIVDDEVSVIKWMLSNIEWEVYNCIVTGYSTNVADAFLYIKEHPVDLLLTDISMPDTTGLDLIKMVAEQFPEIQIIVISAYDKFSYVKAAFKYGIVNYCLKPIDVNELQECLKTAMSIFKERQMHSYNQDKRNFRNSILGNLLNGGISIAKFREQGTLADINFDVLAWQVVLMDVSSLEETETIDLLKSYRENEDKGYYCFLDTNMNFVFILYGDAVSDEVWKIKRILKGDVELFLSVGKVLQSYRQIPESYQVCLDFLNASFIFTRSVVQVEKYSYEKYLDVMKDSDHQQLIKAMKVYDKVGMVEVIQKIVNKYKLESDKKNELVCLAVFLVKNTMPFINRRDKHLYDYCLDELSSSEKMFRWIEDFCGRLIYEDDQSGNAIHPCVKYVLKEIDSRYTDSTLSMKEVAAKYRISAAYLGTLFKEQTGIFFNEYLLKKRLEKVLELLSSGKLGVGEIAAATGFTSQSYLNRVFRRKFGMSPIEYRRNTLGKEI